MATARALLRVIHGLTSNDRMTTRDFCQSFGLYAGDIDVEYVNVHANLPNRITRQAEVTVITYEVLSLRSSIYWFDTAQRITKWTEFSNKIILFPQDDYTSSGVIEDFARNIGAATIYSAVTKDLEVLYPRIFREIEIKSCLTGYLDDSQVANINTHYKKFEMREWDLRNRVRHLPEYFGAAANRKSNITREAARFFTKYGAKVDVSFEPKDVILGSHWLEFLSDTRYTSGSKGGASQSDPYGSLKRSYSLPKPIGKVLRRRAIDGRGDFSAIGPRFLEAGILGVVQILLEDDYIPGWRPWEHYIPCTMDNIEDVTLRLLNDHSIGEAVAQNSHSFFTSNNFFYFSNFVRSFIEEEFIQGYVEGITITSTSPSNFNYLSESDPIIAEQIRRQIKYDYVLGRVFVSTIMRMTKRIPILDSISILCRSTSHIYQSALVYSEKLYSGDLSLYGASNPVIELFTPDSSC